MTMSRKRDSNWSKDEISILLDSIMEVSRGRAAEGRKISSREVFEYAAERLAQRGHLARAERDKCRTKWKKMKEEYTYAKKAREGDARYKEAPGIQPFYDRMEEFMSGNLGNINTHSTLARKSTNSANKNSPAMRTSARIAANSNGTSSSGGSTSTDNNNDNTSSTIVTRTNVSNEYSPNNIHTPSTNNTTSPQSPRQNSRLSSGSSSNAVSISNATQLSNQSDPPPAQNHVTQRNNNSNNNHVTSASLANAGAISLANSHKNNNHNHNPNHNHNHNHNHNNNNSSVNHNANHGGINSTNHIPSNKHQQVQAQQLANAGAGLSQSSQNGDTCAAAAYTTYNAPNSAINTTSNGILPANGADLMSIQSTTEQADISYRVGTGCRQITIFGDHDVDIKFRGDCVTINKIDIDFTASSS